MEREVLGTVADVIVDGPAIAYQVTGPPLGLPATINATTTASSALIASGGFTHITIGLTSTQAGTLTIAKFLDVGGVVSAGTPATASIVAATPLVYDNSATTAAPFFGPMFQSMQITISNSSASTVATLSNLVVLLGPR